MNLLRLTALLVYTVGMSSYGTIFFLWLRRLGKAGWAAQPSSACGARRPADFPVGAIVFVSLAHFTVSLLLTLTSLDPHIRQWPLLTVNLVLVFLFPPLIMHMNYAEIKSEGRLPPGGVWRLGILGAYLISQSISLFTLLGFYRVLPLSPRVPGLVANFSIATLFIIAGIYSTAVAHKARRVRESIEERSSRRSKVALYAILGALCLAIILAQLGWIRFPEFLELLLRSTPLMFLFVGTYFENRFEFFDLFIKRGLFLLLTIVLLTAFFGLALPRLDGFDLSWARPWVYAVVLLPVAASLPWLFRRLGAWLDNFWLGRKFTTVEAVKYFLSSLQSATSERELIDRAEGGISAIFHAPTRIDLGLGEPAPEGFNPVLEVSIRSHQDPLGLIRLGQRVSKTPFFSEDEALVDSLADVFSYMLENMRLQQKKQEQETLAKEQALHASRSELKALRAQINPHFLFNALNAIAGLIHKDPSLADKTVEQLAEVFRYTLRRSESEWSPLEDEMEFARAYLEVEQARFGHRLQFRIVVEEAVKPVRIPTMMVQTLVENAVKHGVSAVRGGGRIEIDARREGERLRIEVADDGPGFRKEDSPERRRETGRDSGYGLRNIRQRLSGYFGGQAELAARRDDTRRMTVVSITIPFSAEPPASAGGEPERSAEAGGIPRR